LSDFAAYGTVKSVIPLFFFLFGIAIGSFLNVCITRIPEGVSIVSPGSRCPRCLTPIKPYDNIPVLGWVLLRGKCRSCSLPISAMYPIIEFLTGAIFVLTYYKFGLNLLTLKWLIFSCLVIVLTVTDLRVRLLPDAITFPGLLVGLLLSLRVTIFDPTAGTLYFRLLRPVHRLPPYPALTFNVLNALLGVLLGSLLLWGAATLYKLVRHREGMGFGDVKMMAMVGAFLGPRETFLTILVGTLLGSIIGLSWVGLLYAYGWKRKLAERGSRRGLGTANSLRWVIATQYQLPLGTFLGVGALVVVYLLPTLLDHLFR
jgi:leader peptidase (prepilin peptidase) / N-methyltransferase